MSTREWGRVRKMDLDAMIDFSTAISIVSRKARLLEYVRLRAQNTRADEAKEQACRVYGDMNDERDSM